MPEQMWQIVRPRPGVPGAKPTARRVEVFWVTGPDDIRRAMVETLRRNWLRSGRPWTHDVEVIVQRKAQERIGRIVRRLEAEGVAPHIQALFAATRKKDAKKLANGMKITHTELAALANNCEQIGFTRRQKTREHVPANLAAPHTSEEVVAAIRARKGVVSHLFERGDEWHCFHADFSELSDQSWLGEKPHWKNGVTHLHYLSHLWPGVGKEQLWAELDARTFPGRGSLHIEYVGG